MRISAPPAEVEPPRRVVFTWGVAGKDSLPPGSITVEIVLTADGPDTVVELCHHDLPAEEFDSRLKGWTAMLDQLGQLRTKAAPPAGAAHQLGACSPGAAASLGAIDGGLAQLDTDGCRPAHS